MNARFRFLAAISFGVCVTFAQLSTATAAEITVFTSRAVATVLEKIGPEFERTSGHKLNVVSGFGPVFLPQINAGEPFDIFVSTPATLDALFKSGVLAPDSRTNLVRSGIGVEVRTGAPKPD